MEIEPWIILILVYLLAYFVKWWITGTGFRWGDSSDSSSDFWHDDDSGIDIDFDVDWGGDGDD